MAKQTVFDLIKKQNGEQFAQAIRVTDNGIFEVPDIVSMLEHAGKNAIPILPFLRSLKNIQIEEHGVYESPVKLLKKAGYYAFVVDSFEKQLAIKHFFAPHEQICTFGDFSRYLKNHIIYAIKEVLLKDKDAIKRGNPPDREDEYGRSVISIQIDKKGGIIFITNRYNHSVDNPDFTFQSNPDNIIKGLSESLKHFFNVDFSSAKAALPKNYIMVDNKIIKFNLEIYADSDSKICEFHIGSDFYLKDRKMHFIDKDKEIIMDNFLFNTKTKKLVDITGEYADGFIMAFEDEIKGKSIQIKKGKNAERLIFANDKHILSVKAGAITALHFESATIIESDFLCNNKELKELSLPNAAEIDNNFLLSNKKLKNIYLPNVKYIGNSFLKNNTDAEEVFIPRVKSIGNYFLYLNDKITSISLPAVEYLGCGFLYANQPLNQINLPKVVTVGNNSLSCNKALTTFDLPRAKTVGDNVLSLNSIISNVNLPKTASIGYEFLSSNTILTAITLPSAKNIEIGFLRNNKDIKMIHTPKLSYNSFLKIINNDPIKKNVIHRFPVSIFFKGFLNKR